MINDEDVRAVGTVVGGAGGFAALAMGIRSYIIRRWSRDRLEGRRDKGEIELIDELRQENRALRQRADTAFDERNKAIEELGGLRFEVHALRGQVDELQKVILQMRTQLEQKPEGRT